MSLKNGTYSKAFKDKFNFLYNICYNLKSNNKRTFEFKMSSLYFTFIFSNVNTLLKQNR